MTILWNSLKQNKGKLNSMNVYPIILNILSTDNKVMKLKDRQFDEVEDVEFCFDMFKDIMSTINLHVIYVPNQQSFCMFMGWTDRIYKKMLNNSLEDIQDMMQFVNEYIIACQTSAGQTGIAKQNRRSLCYKLQENMVKISLPKKSKMKKIVLIKR